MSRGFWKFTQRQADSWASPFAFLPILLTMVWSVVVMIGAPAAILYHKVTLLKVVE